jgi:hypothetical protein
MSPLKGLSASLPTYPGLRCAPSWANGASTPPPPRSGVRFPRSCFLGEGGLSCNRLLLRSERPHTELDSGALNPGTGAEHGCWSASQKSYRSLCRKLVSPLRGSLFSPLDRGLTPAANTNLAATRLVQVGFDLFVLLRNFISGCDTVSHACC